MTHKGWKRVGKRAHHGISIPVAFLRSAKSQGVGDFGDLHLLLSFCNKVGFDLIQLLPIQDSADQESPYSAKSSCALHPIYIDLTAIPFIEKDGELLEKIEKMRSLNQSEYVDYQAVLASKLAFLRIYSHKYGKDLEDLVEFQQFVHGSPWLFEYVAFQLLK